MKLYFCMICDLEYPAEEMEFNRAVGSGMSMEFNYCIHCEAEILELMNPLPVLYFY